MNFDQIFLLVLLACVFALLIWGRWRFDLIAFTALVVALLAGVIPANEAFSGFGHPATVIIALVLIVSRALTNSGVIELIGRYMLAASRSLSMHVGLMAGIAAALSAVMNNVAALALLMPVDIEAASKADRSPALTLMPLSFASILGGMITLIGTPPNIVVAEFRNEALGEPFAMFDFAPVGLACAVVGVAYVALIGWRLIPRITGEAKPMKTLLDFGEYVAEVRVPEGAGVVGKHVRDLDDAADDVGATIIGLVRRGRRMPGMARLVDIRVGDTLVLEAHPDAIDRLVGVLKLEYVRSGSRETPVANEDLSLMEVVVPEGSRIEGRSAASLRLLGRYDVTLLGVSRQGRRFREQVRKLEIAAGDVLLLLGPTERLPEVTTWLGCFPLAERGLHVIQRQKAFSTIGIFATAVLLASFGVVYLPVALAAAVALLVVTKVVPLRQLYDSIEWPVIVLLGSMIPIGVALESSGATALIAAGIVDLSAGLAPAVILTILMIVTMTLSDVMNNVATAVIAAPIALDISVRLGVNADPFLMTVAVAASCAFLTPIGHKNNTLIMGPGGYRFGDYWRMGLPLEILVVATGVPMILWVWPL
ncbi:MAG: SLC13 family permease [Gammaproteobacteria bacterium]|nr:SLC13 family permease [Gammaproteobacteria bacterium]MDH3506208.1 SLC13 family permease [Gammaproteobacteria bacterium]